ncbi:MAG: hypothetical protein J5764_04965 [Bacteroidales bacterium]|nr:hypothetical protein [Bacteroidales bacterium]
MKRFWKLLALAAIVTACSAYEIKTPASGDGQEDKLQLSDVARILSSLPLESSSLEEVYDAVSSSSTNGYDEEYMMKNLFSDPGSGVGDKPGKTQSKTYSKPLRELFAEYFAEAAGSKAGDAAQVQDYLQALEESDIQIYWPYSEDWDGKTYPVITWDPGFGAESNYGYEVALEDGKLTVKDSVYVNEALAASRPVWVINRNDDSAFSPLDLYELPEPAARINRKLYIKSFTMLRNYDSWFGGASEFVIRCGSADGFKASTEAELKNYKPSITEFMIVVKRRQLRQEIPLDIVLMTDFTSAVEKVAFLVTEDDGGTRTSWKCSAVVKYKSKSFGFEMDIPYNEKDDIVWRGQLASTFFQEEDEVSARLGDVIVKFALE